MLLKQFCNVDNNLSKAWFSLATQGKAQAQAQGYACACAYACVEAVFTVENALFSILAPMLASLVKLLELASRLFSLDIKFLCFCLCCACVAGENQALVLLSTEEARPKIARGVATAH